MAIIKRKGEPTERTEGAVGDIYIDDATGNQYECIFSYKEEPKGSLYTQWKNLNKKVPVEHKSESTTPAVKPSKEKSVKVEKPEAKPSEKDTAQKRTNYTAYSKKNN